MYLYVYTVRISLNDLVNRLGVEPKYNENDVFDVNRNGLSLCGRIWYPLEVGWNGEVNVIVRPYVVRKEPECTIPLLVRLAIDHNKYKYNKFYVNGKRRYKFPRFNKPVELSLKLEKFSLVGRAFMFKTNEYGELLVDFEAKSVDWTPYGIFNFLDKHYKYEGKQL